MLLEIAIAVVFLMLIVTIAHALSVFGLFYPVEVKTGPPPVEFSGMEVAYKLERGPYRKSGHLFTMIHGDLVGLVDEERLPSLPMIGLYYDDPTVTEAEKCRYAVGVIMTKDDEQLKQQLSERDYQFTRLPKIDYVVYSMFPYAASFSIYIAVKRVYPAIREYIRDHKLCAHPCIEIYQAHNIYFVLPLSKQDHFYLFDDEEEFDEECSSSDCESRSGSESNYSHGGSVPRHYRTDRSQSLPLSGSSSRRHSTTRRDSSTTVNETSQHDDLDLDPAQIVDKQLSPSKRSSTASSFEELTTAEAASVSPLANNGSD